MQAALLTDPWSLEFQKESPHKSPGSRGNGHQERRSVTWGDWPQDWGIQAGSRKSGATSKVQIRPPAGDHRRDEGKESPRVGTLTSRTSLRQEASPVGKTVDLSLIFN